MFAVDDRVCLLDVVTSVIGGDSIEDDVCGVSSMFNGAVCEPLVAILAFISLYSAMGSTSYSGLDDLSTVAFRAIELVLHGHDDGEFVIKNCGAHIPSFG